MDISSRFPLVDFLAYLFPGIVDTLGLYQLLLFLPLSSPLPSVQADFFTGVLFITLSYIVGVVVSGFTEIVMKKGWAKGPIWSKSIIPVPEYKEEIIAAFNQLMQKDTDAKSEWSLSNFYICRSLVLERMPRMAQTIDRQGSLRQLRMNLIPAISIWSLVIVFQGIQELLNNQVALGVSLIVIPILLWWPITKGNINRMNRNEDREVREVLTAFLVGYKTGVFDKKRNDKLKE